MADEESERILINTPPIDYGSKNISSVRTGRGSPPPPYEELPASKRPYKPEYGSVECVNSGGEPSNFDVVQNGHYITCKVCKAEIDIVGKRDQFVVKCQKCNEATPIQTPPAGKKYVRCPCNCLLVCKTSSQRIACPRAGCRRIINVGNNPITPPGSSFPGATPNKQRVTCIHCNEIFLFDQTNKAMAKCPHCRGVSSVGINPSAPLKGFLYLLLGVILLGVSVFFILWTKPDLNEYPGYFALYTACVAIISWAFWRSRYYFYMKVSSVDSG